MSVVDDYAQSLKELTFNSRPIIETLTTIARENPEHSDGIITAISNRIYKCIPEHKLFALFLLDSVCKYAGNSYNILVGEEIFQLYSHVFQFLNEQIRKTKLLLLFETWKVTKTKGTNFPLFPKEQLDKIELFLRKAGYLRDDTVTAKQLIGDIDRLLSVFQMRMAESGDQKLQTRYDALTQLRTLLSSQQMSQQDLKMVQKTIKEQEASASTPPTPATTPGPSYSQASPQVPSSSTPAINTAIPAQVPSMPTPMSSVSNEKAEGLFQALLSSGLVDVEQAPVPGSRAQYQLVYPQIKYMPNAMPLNSTLQDILSLNSLLNKLEFERAKFAELASLQVTDEQQFVSHNSDQDRFRFLLYEAKPSKCLICGKSFSTDLMASNSKRLHLDWHFRINKKLNAGGNVQLRNWYLDDYDWVNFREEDLSNDANSGAVALEAEPTEGPVPYVQVPPQDTNMNNRCLLCREVVKATYHEEIGEWCWYNCVLAPGEKPGSRKIVHVFCSSSDKRANDGDLGAARKREKHT